MKNENKKISRIQAILTPLTLKTIFFNSIIITIIIYILNNIL